MKRLFMVFGFAVAFGFVASIAVAEDVRLETISSPDGGSFCSSAVGSGRQYAVQCDAGMFVRTCQWDGGGCANVKGGDVRVGDGVLFDIPMPSKPDGKGRVCVQPEFVNTAGACKLFLVDPPQYKVNP